MRIALAAVAGLLAVGVTYDAQASVPGDGIGASFAWNGVDGRPIQIGVSGPSASKLANVVTIQPHIGGTDQDFASALAQIAKGGGGTLRLVRGATYEIKASPAQNTEAIEITNMSDLMIDGSGATILFDNPGDGLRIASSNRVKIRGVTIRYAHPGVVLGRVTSVNGAPAIRLDAPAGGRDGGGRLQIYAVRDYDRQAGNVPFGGSRQLFNNTGTTLPGVGDNTYAAPPVRGFRLGSSVLLKTGYYQGAAIRIADRSDHVRSNNIIIEHVAILNSSGLGVVSDGMGRGLAIIDSVLGAPGLGPAPVSIPYDGIHLSAVQGDVIIEHNQIHGTNDDAINLASLLAEVVSGAGSSVVNIGKGATLISSGSSLSFFDGNMRPLGHLRVLKRRAAAPDGSAPVALESPAPAATKFVSIDDFAGSRYAIVRNDIGRCACHGVLAQASDGLIALNHFDNLTANAIRVLGSAYWREGPGVRNVIVSRNTIQNTGPEPARDLVWGAITVYGETASRGNSPQPVLSARPLNTRVRITGNVIRRVSQACVAIASSGDVAIAGNQCQPGADATAKKGLSGDWRQDRPGVWIDHASTANVSVQ